MKTYSHTRRLKKSQGHAPVSTFSYEHDHVSKDEIHDEITHGDNDTRDTTEEPHRRSQRERRSHRWLGDFVHSALHNVSNKQVTKNNKMQYRLYNSNYLNPEYFSAEYIEFLLIFLKYRT